MVRMNTIASCDQIKPVSIGENFVAVAAVPMRFRCVCEEDLDKVLND